MANSLEKFFLGKVKQMPPVEFEMTPDQLRKPSNKKPQAIRGKRVLPPGAGATVSASASPVSATSTDLIINNDKKPDLGRTPLVVQVASSSSISLAFDGD